MNDIMKIVQALKNSGVLLKSVTKTIKNETEEHKGGYLSLLPGTIAIFLPGNLLTGKVTVRAGEGSIRAREGILKKYLIPRNSSPHPSTNFEIQEYYKNEPRFNGVYLEIIYLKQ